MEDGKDFGVGAYMVTRVNASNLLEAGLEGGLVTREVGLIKQIMDEFPPIYF